MEQLLPFQHSIPQRSTEWYLERSRRITASEVATILGQNPFQSAEQLMMEKLGLKQRFMGNEATEHGQKYEDEAIALYAKEREEKVLSFGLMIHPSIPFLGASPDGITESSHVLVEVKVRVSSLSTPSGVG